MKPLITVVIPTYNSKHTIGPAIESMLQQTYSNIEVVVIDDDSTDNTEQIVQAYERTDSRVSYYRVPTDDPYRINRLGVNINAGYMARNFGVEQASGDIITFQDADDVSYANRIEIQHALLEKYGAMHSVVDYQNLEGSGEEYIGKSLNIDTDTIGVIGFEEVSALVKKNKPIPAWLLDPHSMRPVNSASVRFLKRIGRQLFWRDITPYPGSGNSAMVRREVFYSVRFRPLWERTRPSRRGRGADMDFNYAVAAMFGRSIVIQSPLYLWRR